MLKFDESLMIINMFNFATICNIIRIVWYYPIIRDILLTYSRHNYSILSDVQIITYKFYARQFEWNR